MRISGQDILKSALSEIIGEASGEQEYLDVAAKLAKIHLDALDQKLLSGGTRVYEVEYSHPGVLRNFPGWFDFWDNTSGPLAGGEDSRAANAPTGGIVAWSMIDPENGEERPQGVSGIENDAIITASQYQLLIADKGIPTSSPPGNIRYLWQDRGVGGNLSRFRIVPPPGDDTENNPVKIWLYAMVPAIREIKQGVTYDLPQGVAGYLNLSLAAFLAPHFGNPVPYSLWARLRAAETNLIRRYRENSGPPVPDVPRAFYFPNSRGIF